MSSRTARNEGANAEILGVVILIGIFAITAGIISATTLASPAPVKVPAATIEITGKSGAIHIAHLGGDPLPPDTLVVGTKSDGTTDTLTLDAWLDGISGAPLSNGFSEVADDNWVALALVWSGGSGRSVIASWDPTGIYGPLGPAAIAASVPMVSTPAPTQPTWPTPTTAWNATIQKITANFAQDRTAASAGEAVQFTNTSAGNVTIDAWSWQFGDGTTSTLQNPTHSYSHTGTYTVTLTASNISTGASDTVVKENCVQVGEPGPSPVDFDMTATQGGVALTVVCTDKSASSPTLWRWTTIDGLNGTVTTVGPDNIPIGMNDTYNPKVQAFTFLNPSGVVNNTCLIKLEVWSPYFQSPISCTKFVTVGPPMQADFQTNLTSWIGVAGASGAPIHFLDGSIGIPQEWHWDFGDGNTSTEQNPTHTFTVGPNEIRTFHVALIVKGWEETSSVTHDLTIYPPVIANSEANPTQGSAPLVVHFKDNSTGFPTSWLWDFGDGSSSTEQNPVHTFNTVGKYRVTLFAERAEPHSVAPEIREIVILVGNEVSADFTGTPRSGQAPLSVQFTDLSLNATYRWSWKFGDGNTSMTRNPLHTYYTPGNYTVTLVAENPYRLDTETKEGYISVIAPITASFNASPTVVQNGTTVQFTNTSTGNPYSFAWDFGDGTTSTEKNPVHAYTKAGTYDVSLTATNPLGSDPVTVPDCITVFDQVQAQFTASVKKVRVNAPVKFTDSSTGNPTSWTWDFGDGTTFSTTDPTKKDPTHNYASTGSFFVTLTVSNGYTSYTKMDLDGIIVVYGDLISKFTANQTSGPRSLTVQFTDTSEGTPESWEWDFNSDGVIDSTLQNPVHTFPVTGIYTVALTVRHPHTDAHGVDTSVLGPITVFDPLAAEFAVNATGGALPFTVQFTRGTIGGGNRWTWNFGDGSATSNELNPIHTYTSRGTFAATLTVWNDIRSNLTVNSSKNIDVYGLPNAAFTASKLTGSAPLTIQFTDTSTGTPTGWDWNFGDGTTFSTTDPTTKSPSHTFTESGRAYIVTLRVHNAAGEDPTPASSTITVM